MTQIQKQITYWKTSAKRDFETAKVLYRLKRYDMCLFLCHLTLEKLLKGLVTERTKKRPPYTHDLVRLSELAELSPSMEQRKHLGRMTTFNQAGRYDDEKYSFYKICTRSYITPYLDLTKEYFVWLENLYPKPSKKK